MFLHSHTGDCVAGNNGLIALLFTRKNFCPRALLLWDRSFYECFLYPEGVRYDSPGQRPGEEIRALLSPEGAHYLLDECRPFRA